MSLITRISQIAGFLYSLAFLTHRFSLTLFFLMCVSTVLSRLHFSNATTGEEVACSYFFSLRYYMGEL